MWKYPQKPRKNAQSTDVYRLDFIRWWTEQIPFKWFQCLNSLQTGAVKITSVTGWRRALECAYNVNCFFLSDGLQCSAPFPFSHTLKKIHIPLLIATTTAFYEASYMLLTSGCWIRNFPSFWLKLHPASQPHLFLWPHNLWKGQIYWLEFYIETKLDKSDRHDQNKPPKSASLCVINNTMSEPTWYWVLAPIPVLFPFYFILFSFMTKDRSHLE